LAGAEGVGTKEQFERLALDCCNEVQDYLSSPPRPAGEIKRLLAAQNVPAEAVV